jgi:t-SNARE complex subunit (syntaxin)
MSEVRTRFVQFRINDEEKKCIDIKFKKSGYKSKSKFFRYSLVLAPRVNIHNEKFEELKKLLSVACTNLNQIAHKTNYTKSVSENDFEELREVKKQLENFVLDFTEYEIEIKNQIWS